ncbi:MAG: DNA/RNA non-specific endonuclease [Bacteriovoracales bacterium]
MKAFKKNIFFLLLFFLFNYLAYAQVVIGNIPLNENPNILKFIPQNIRKVPEVLISRKQYLLSYNQKTRLLNWVAWKLDSNDIGSSGRSNNFSIDPDLEKYLRESSLHAVSPRDYKGSCFDRGHQVPSADRTDSLENNQMTFLMSNMIPQTAYLNQVIWKSLEEYTRELVIRENKRVYVIAGPIFDEDFGSIGPKKDISIPSKDFKIVIVPNENDGNAEIISVIMPNRLKSGKRPFEDRDELCSNRKIDSVKDNDWEKYKTTLAEIEKVSGFRLIKSLK